MTETRQRRVIYVYINISVLKSFCRNNNTVTVAYHCEVYRTDINIDIVVIVRPTNAEQPRNCLPGHKSYIGL